jgi:hypothetical protein
MDLPLYARVLWRFKILVIGGFLAAVLLSTFAVVRVSFSHGFGVSYRQNQQWVSNATLFVTQEGFPWGYAAPPQAPTTPQADVQAKAKQLTGKQFADPNRFPGLASLYSYFATSDPVKEIMRRHGKIDGEISSLPVVATQYGYGTTLPLVAISGISTTPAKARSLAIRATDAFQTFLEEQQTRNLIPAQNRVLVTVLQAADKPKLLRGRSKTLPLVAFMTVMIAVVGLAFLLENLRPRALPVAAEDVARLPVPGAAPGQQSA